MPNYNDVRDRFIIDYGRYGGTLNRHGREIDISRSAQEKCFQDCFPHHAVVFAYTPRRLHIFVKDCSGPDQTFCDELESLVGARPNGESKWPDLYFDEEFAEDWFDRPWARAYATG